MWKIIEFCKKYLEIDVISVLLLAEYPDEQPDERHQAPHGKE